MENIKPLIVRKFTSKHLPIPRGFESFTLPPCQNLDLEIGCGVGLHPVQFGKKYPERTLIAIEHTKNKFDKFSRRIQKNNLDNIIAIHANAISWISHFIKEESIENIFIYYPNPNPKSSDISKRWHAMPFMSQLIKILKPGGCIHFATNEDFYAQELNLYMKNYWKLECLKNEIINQKCFIPRTHFEKKYLKSGQNCFDLIFQKP